MEFPPQWQAVRFCESPWSRMKKFGNTITRFRGACIRIYVIMCIGRAQIFRQLARRVWVGKISPARGADGTRRARGWPPRTTTACRLNFRIRYARAQKGIVEKAKSATRKCCLLPGRIRRSPKEETKRRRTTWIRPGTTILRLRPKQRLRHKAGTAGI